MAKGYPRHGVQRFSCLKKMSRRACMEDFRESQTGCLLTVTHWPSDHRRRNGWGGPAFAGPMSLCERASSATPVRAFVCKHGTCSLFPRLCH